MTLSLRDLSGSVQFSPLLDRGVLGRPEGRMSRDPLPVFFFFCFLLEAILTNSGMGRNVRSLALSIKHVQHPTIHPYIGLSLHYRIFNVCKNGKQLLDACEIFRY